MSDKQYDSVLCGWTEEPRYYEDQLSSWSCKFKVSELKDMIENYSTPIDENGQGGNVRIKLFMSKNGKPCCSVWDPKNAKTKDIRANKAQQETSDLPF
tara:strand:+ start:761 stop:1054 length:294 start_codon:yes stop_codon:yes gene_type:complete